MEAIAKTKHLKGSPRKARLVIDMIRGRNVSQALNILKFTDKRAADPIEKTLRSAIANATYLAEQQNIAIDPDDLFVKTCFVDMGAHKNRRRMRPAPQGRAFREQRHYCHITILVSSDKDATNEGKTAKKTQRTAAEKGDSGQKLKAEPKAKAEKKPAKTTEQKTEKAPKKTKAEKTVVQEEVVETQTPIVETPTAVAETPVVSDPVAEMMDTKEMPKAEETVEAKATETPEVAEEKAPETVETETVEAKNEEPKVETEEAKSAKDADSDLLEVESPKAEAKAKVDKQKAEASDAKNVQSQTPAERNETKKADNAQLDENDLLELQ